MYLTYLIHTSIYEKYSGEYRTSIESHLLLDVVFIGCMTR